MFKRMIGEKAEHYWTESVDGEITFQSELFATRGQMLAAMHSAMRDCYVNGTVFQPWIKQLDECAEWGEKEIVTYEFYAVNDGDEDVAFFWTLEDARAYLKTAESPIRIMDKDHTRIYLIKD